MPPRQNHLATMGLCWLLTLLTGCGSGSRSAFGSGGPKVRVAVDDTANFASYHTYVFLPGELSGDPAVVKVTPDELDRRVSAALAAKLPAKGLRPATGNDPGDLYVTYVATVRREAEIVHNGGARGQGYDEPGAIPPGKEWNLRSFDEGMVVLQFADAKTRAGVWRATVAADADAVESVRALDRALDAALRNYPPKKK
jgi:hypothetical protein